MLNTFRISRRKRRKRRWNARRVLRIPHCRSRGRRKRYGERGGGGGGEGGLAYANFVIDLSTPARKFNFRPRAMFDTAIQRGPNLLDLFSWFLSTLSNVLWIANMYYHFQKATPLESAWFIHQRLDVYSKITFTTLHRKRSTTICNFITYHTSMDEPIPRELCRTNRITG